MRESITRRKYGFVWQEVWAVWSGRSQPKREAITGYLPQFSYWQILCSWLGGFLGIAVLAYLSVHTSYPLIAAPFGATAVLVFAVPDSPLAQPRNVIGGNWIGACTCVLLVQDASSNMNGHHLVKGSFNGLIR